MLSQVAAQNNLFINKGGFEAKDIRLILYHEIFIFAKAFYLPNRTGGGLNKAKAPKLSPSDKQKGIILL